MFAADTKTFNQAVAMAQAGQKQQAYTILNELVSRIKDSGNLYLWIAFTTPDMDEARYMINKAASIDPANPALGQAFNWLADEEAKLKAPVPAMAAVSSNYQITPAYSNSAPPPPPTQAVTPASEPTPLPINTSPKGRRWLLPVVFGGAAVLGVVGIVLLVYTLFIADKIAMQGLPVYNNANKLDLGGERDNISKLFEGLSFGLIKNIQMEVYSIKTTEKNKAQAFYDKELKNQGWKYTPEASKDGSYSYLKDNKMFLITISQPANSTLILPGFNNKVQADEVLMLIMVAEMSINQSSFK